MMRAVLWIFLACAIAIPALAQEPDFFLDFESGGHRSAVRKIAFVDGGDTILSISEDKTARVWDWQAGINLSTLRGQIGAGNDGKILALATIPGTPLVATGGFFAAPYSGESFGDVRLFNRRSGRIETVLSGLDLPVFGLSASTEGNRLAAAGQDGIVQIWNRDDTGWQASDRIEGPYEGLRDVAFARGDNRLVATSAGAGARLWTLGGSPTEIPVDSAAAFHTALAISPDGTKFALGGTDGSIEVRSTEDGTLVTRLQDRPFLPGALAFLGETRLVVACAIECEKEHRSEIWDIRTGNRLSTYQGHGPGIYSVAVAPDGRTIAVSGGYHHEIHLWDSETGTGLKTLVGQGHRVTGVGVTPDGSRIGWGTEDPCPELNSCPGMLAPLREEIDLPTRENPFTSPRRREGAGEGFDRTRFAVGETTLRAVTDPAARYENTVLEILRQGTVTAEIGMTPDTGYYHSGFTLLPKGDLLVTAGSDGQMAEHDTETGAYTGAYASVSGHTDDVLSLTAASQAPLLVSGGADKTFRLWNTDTRALIASVFLTETEWIIWTPQGYYLSSPEGDRLIGWHVNQGRDREARFIRARQLKRHLYSPEIVRRAIVTGDPAQAALDLRGRDDQLSDLLKQRPMDYSVRFLDTAPGPGGTARLEITAEATEENPPQRFTVIVNDRVVADVVPRNLDMADGSLRQIIDVPVEDGSNQIHVAGTDDHGYLIERGTFALFEKAETQPQGRLYLAVVGVQDYPFLPTQCGGRSCNLSFPVADAAEFLKVVSDKTAPMFEGMEVLALANQSVLVDAPSRAAIFDALAGGDVLEPEARNIDAELIDFLSLPGPEDTVILFVAGHGINIGEDYYLIASDGRMRDETRWRRSSLVDWRRIQEAVDGANGRRILVLDTCHAENAYNPRLEKDAADSRVIVLSATATNNTAAEMAQLGHGVFTYALLEGLRGAAATGPEGVRLFALADFVSREVSRLTSKRQEPFYHVGSSPNFLMALP